MSDTAEKLRNMAFCLGPNDDAYAFLNSAAAELDRLRAALQMIVTGKR